MATALKRLVGQVLLPTLLVPFYRFWHGKLHWPGAGLLLHRAAAFLPGLQNYSLPLPDGATIRVDFRDVTAFSWQNHLLGEPYEEQGLISAILSRPKAKGVCWDVGANGGLFSYLLAKRARPRKIEFFEPQPYSYRMAADALAPFPFVRGHNCGLSNREGVVQFHVPKGESTKAHIELPGSVGQKLKVKIETGDLLMDAARAEPSDLIKIDTEGHEREVLAGLERTLRYRKPDIFLEHLSLEDMEMRALCPPGYRLFTVSDSSGALVEGLHRELGHNSAFLPQETV